jgi:C4-dicarboxylate transporter, DctM subunit
MEMLYLALFLIVLVVAGIPIAFALGIAGLTAIWLTSSVPLMIVPLVVFNQADSYSLIAVPLFMLAGAIVEKCGLGKVLVAFASSLVGWVRGGLAQVNVLVSLFFAGMNGSAPADVASMGSILIPEMKRRGYSAGFAAGVTSASAELAILIPPSITLILYGVLANVSITRMFIAAIIPGLMIALANMILVGYLAVRNDFPVHEKFEVKKTWTTFKSAWWGLSLPVIILGGILGGIFTATESAAVAAVTALLLAVLVYRSMSWRKFPEILILTAKRTGMVMLIIASSGILSFYLAEQGIPQRLAQQVLAFTTNQAIILLILNIALFLVGMMISGAPAIVLFVPLMLPIAVSSGVDPIHFGVIFSVAIAIGTQTPPVAPTMLLACVIGETTIGEVWKTNRWFISVNLVILMILTYFPALSLWLPDRIL